MVFNRRPKGQSKIYGKKVYIILREDKSIEEGKVIRSDENYPYHVVVKLKDRRVIIGDEIFSISLK